MGEREGEKRGKSTFDPNISRQGKKGKLVSHKKFRRVGTEKKKVPIKAIIVVAIERGEKREQPLRISTTGGRRGMDDNVATIHNEPEWSG